MSITPDGSVVNLLKCWEASTEWERSDGLRYYVEQRCRIASQSSCMGFDNLMIAIAAFVALSPNNDEDGNYRDLRTCLRAWQETNLDPSGCSSYPKNVDKAMRLLYGETYPEQELRGRKTLSFYHNTIDPTDPHWVTIDGHMVSTWLGRRVLLRRRTDKNIESAEINGRIYKQISDDVRTAAKKVRVIPCQFQSTVWLTWKRLHNIRYKPQLVLAL
jgi:hypothetical protein